MQTLPLFVLPMVLLPGEIRELRVFEPRYKQMLDDCLLDEKNFGLIQNNEKEKINHWDSPRNYGCEAEIIHHETKGSNHFLQIIGRRRFIVKKLNEPALPPLDHPSMDHLTQGDGIFPDLESLLDSIPDGKDNSKLYINAEVEYIEPLDEIT